MRHECIDTIVKQPAPHQTSWANWIKAGVTLLKSDMVLLMTALVRAQRRYHERQMLRRLSDETLKDVGLSRCDIENEIDRPFWK